jgi:hypothetical protein
MISRRALLCASAAALGVSVLPRRVSAKKPEPAPIPTLPLFVSVAEEQGAPVRDETWINGQLAEVARLFSPIGLSFRKRAGSALPESLARLETRDDRDALAAHLEPKVIHVMVVSSLRDVDDPTLLRMGVHWRHRKKPAKHWVIVAASARPSTLAHELGHYFGLDHSSVTDNLMSYSRTGAPPFLEPAQIERVRAMARMYVSSKLVLPA